MTDHLFDPAPYGPGKPEPRPRRRAAAIVNDGHWWVLRRAGRSLDAKAHRKADVPRDRFGADRTVCRRLGQLIPVPLGVEVLAACEECAAEGAAARSDAS